MALTGSGEGTFFLCGPRHAGKISLLRQWYPDGVQVDLLKADGFCRDATRLELLRRELEAAGHGTVRGRGDRNGDADQHFGAFSCNPPPPYAPAPMNESR